MITKVLHTGFAVPNLETSIQFYKSLGFSVEKTFDKPELNARAAMISRGETTFELFEFSTSDNPQVNFIRNHIALYSNDLETDLTAMLTKDYVLTIPVTEGVLYRYAYVQDSAGTNYELATDKN